MPYVRNMQWRIFGRRVDNHIKTYTVPQYGDAPDDQVQTMSPEMMVENMKRYLNRFGTNQRGPEDQKRDLLKLAHYACLCYDRLFGTEPYPAKEHAPEKREGDYGHNPEKSE